MNCFGAPECAMLCSCWQANRTLLAGSSGTMHCTVHVWENIREACQLVILCHCQMLHALEPEEDEVAGSFRRCLHSASVHVGVSFFLIYPGSASFVFSCCEFPRA